MHPVEGASPRARGEIVTAESSVNKVRLFLITRSGWRPIARKYALRPEFSYVRRKAAPEFISPAPRSDCAIKVITFEMGYTPGGFDRPVTEHFKDEIQSKLCIAGAVTLTVIFKRGPRGERILYFDGPGKDIARAKAALNLNREPTAIH